MTQFNIAEAKVNFPLLGQKAAMGEEVIIAKDNKPLLKLVPLAETRLPRQPGSAGGKVRMAPDFDAIPAGFEDYS